MVLNLKQLYDIVGEKIGFDYVIGGDKLAEIHGYSFSDGISVSGQAYNRAGVLTLSYTVTFTLKAECDRCLRPFERPFFYEFEHILVRTVNTDNDEYIVTEGDSMDLDEQVITDILIQIPTKLLCKEDCKGLCFVCGADLNQGECGCDRSVSSMNKVIIN